jgi:hypothetical protein
MENGIPNNFKSYFWDCDFTELTLDKYAFFITERILNFGNMESIHWLLENVDEETLRNVVKKSRNLDKKTKNFWEIKLNVK